MKHKLTMLAPESCESAIVTSFAKPKLVKGVGSKSWYLEAKAMVKLSDCNRWITWDMVAYDYEDDTAGYRLAKIRKAIKALVELENLMVAHQSDYVKLKKICNERNKPRKKKAKSDREDDSHE